LLVGGDEEVEQAVVVDVGRVDAHAALGAAGKVVGDACEAGVFFEVAFAVVEEEAVAGFVVGNEDVGIAVVIEIGADNAHAGAVVAEEGEGGGLKVEWSGVGGMAIEAYAAMVFVGEVYIVSGEEIQVAI